jgi:hypothetical protein
MAADSSFAVAETKNLVKRLNRPANQNLNSFQQALNVTQPTERISIARVDGNGQVRRWIHERGIIDDFNPQGILHLKLASLFTSSKQTFLLSGFATLFTSALSSAAII